MPEKNPKRNISKPKQPQKKALAAAGLSEDGRLTGFLVFLFALLAFYTCILLGDGDNYWIDKGYSAFIMALCLLFLLFEKNLFFQNAGKLFTPLFCSVTGYLLLYGITLFYSATGKFALKEFSKIAAAFCIFLLVALLVQKKEVFIDRLLKIISASLAVVGLLSVDAASCRFLSAPFIAVVDFLIPGAGQSYGAFETGARITSVISMPNVFAPLMAIGMFLSLYLYLEAPHLKGRLFAGLCLGLCTVSFILAFSLGTILTMVLCLLGLVLFCPGKRRAELFTTLLFVLGAGIVFSVPAFAALGKAGAVSFMPDLLALLLGVVLAFCKGPALYVSGRIKMESAKNLVIALLSVAAAGVVYAVLGLFVTTAYPLEGAGESFTRSAYLAAGEYSFTAEGDKPIPVAIQSQNFNETVMHKYSGLFSGEARPGEAVSFTVPEGALVVHVTFTGPEGGARVEKAWFTEGASGGKTKNLSLNYPLLPAFAANRLQGLWANQNAIQRFAFIADGLKIFAQNPVLGSGPGAFEALQTGVQDFYYESKYVHNHYVQVLLEAGIFGFLFFLAMGWFSFATVWRNRKTQRRPLLLTVLLACLIMVFVHALIEVDLSYGTFLGVFFALLGLLSAQYGEAAFAFDPQRIRGKKKAALIRGGTAAFLGVMLLFLGFNVWAYNKVISAETDVAGALDTAVLFDPFNDIDYQMTYLVRSVNEGQPLPNADHYAEDLSKKRLFPATRAAALYYFGKYDIQKGFEMSQRTLTLDRSRPSRWEDEFSSYANCLTPEYISATGAGESALREVPQGIEQSYEMLLAFNKERLEPIYLTRKALYTLMKAKAILAADEADFAAQAAALTGFYYDSAIFIDQDEDGRHDLLSAAAGSDVKIGSDGSVMAGPGGGTVTLPLYFGEYGRFEIRLHTDTGDKISNVALDWGEPVTFDREENGALCYRFEVPLPMPREGNLVVGLAPDARLGRIEMIKKE